MSDKNTTMFWALLILAQIHIDNDRAIIGLIAVGLACSTWAFDVLKDKK